MTDIAEVATLVRRHRRVVVACHENPDGDAVGSLLGLTRALTAADYDVIAWAPGSSDLPRDYTWLGLDEIVRTVPADIGDRLLVAVDCGSADRLGGQGKEAVEAAIATANVDHHGDNTRFGTANWVDATAPCTAVLVHRLLDELELPVDERVATPLYVGLVTDTGDFRYANAGVRSHREAIRLIEAGARPDEIARTLHGARPLARVRLLGRALARFESRASGRLVITWVTVADLEEFGAVEEDCEGIVSHLRDIDGVEVAALLREPRDPTRGRWKGSLRSGRPEVDVRSLAQRFGGGGHPQAAGFSSDLPLAELLQALERAVDDAAD